MTLKKMFHHQYITIQILLLHATLDFDFTDKIQEFTGKISNNNYIRLNFLYNCYVTGII